MDCDRGGSRVHVSKTRIGKCAGVSGTIGADAKIVVIVTVTPTTTATTTVSESTTTATVTTPISLLISVPTKLKRRQRTSQIWQLNENLTIG